MKTEPYDTAEHLDTDEAVAGYIEAVLEDGDPALIRYAVGTVARAWGMSQIAREMGLPRDDLYRLLNEDENPGSCAVAGVLEVLGVRLNAQSIDPPAAEAIA